VEVRQETRKFVYNGHSEHGLVHLAIFLGEYPITDQASSLKTLDMTQKPYHAP